MIIHLKALYSAARPLLFPHLLDHRSVRQQQEIPLLSVFAHICDCVPCLLQVLKGILVMEKKFFSKCIS
ncbi:hypothetical protein XELAEV_18007904mg [Xenopus laevis]|uniref:Uncharacterized protein n=1 Tax=Xenopus laevis TaxID=8355 RepID=A0A974E2S3_XENLA|nr:hypothetical protein XELAEV_18007904mg [Xenopus laevis]